MELDKKIDITLEDGKIVQGELLFTFEANGDEFVMYSLEDKAYGAKVLEDGSLTSLEKDEWKILEKMFNEYQREGEENEDK